MEELPYNKCELCLWIPNSKGLFVIHIFKLLSLKISNYSYRFKALFQCPEFTSRILFLSFLLDLYRWQNWYRSSLQVGLFLPLLRCLPTKFIQQLKVNAHYKKVWRCFNLFSSILPTTLFFLLHPALLHKGHAHQNKERDTPCHQDQRGFHISSTFSLKLAQNLYHEFSSPILCFASFLFITIQEKFHTRLQSIQTFWIVLLLLLILQTLEHVHF